MARRALWKSPKGTNRTTLWTMSREARVSLERYDSFHPKIDQTSYPSPASCGISSIGWTGSSPEGSNAFCPTRGTTPNTCPTACGCGLPQTPRRQRSLSAPSVLQCSSSNSGLRSSPSSSSTSFPPSPSPSSPRLAQSSASAS